MRRETDGLLHPVVELAAPHTWPAAILPVLVGAAFAAVGGPIRSWRILAVLAVAVLLQSAVNTLNDRKDFVSGLDTAENCDDPTDAALIYTGITPRGALWVGIGFLLSAAVLGGLLVAACGWIMLLYGVLGLAAILLYVLPGISFSELPLGELLSGITMGGVLPCAAYHAAAGSFRAAMVLYAVPSVILVGCIMLVNNTSDIEKDAEGGRKTLAVLIGRSKAQVLLHILIVLAGILITVLTIVVNPGGIPALAAGWIGLAINSNVRGLFCRKITPVRRRESMQGILAVNKWLLGCFATALLLSIMM